MYTPCGIQIPGANLVLSKYERDAYEELLDQYESEIDMLNSKLNRTEEENKYLFELMRKEQKLRKFE